MEHPIALGVDIGGSHITAGLVNLEAGAVLPDSCIRRAVNPGGTIPEIIGAWAEVIREVWESSFFLTKRIGIAIPGPFDYIKGISYIRNQGKYDALYGVCVKQLLARELSLDLSDIRFANDASSFLSGEVVGGAAKGYKRAIGLTLGTGLGSATYANGLATDAVLWKTSFKGGIAEDYLCTRWFIRRYQELTDIRFTGGVKELMELSQQEPIAREVFKTFGKNLAEFLTLFIERANPEVVILGGNITHAYALFSDELEKGLAENVTTLPLLNAVLGERASMIGAAGNWLV